MDGWITTFLLGRGYIFDSQCLKNHQAKGPNPPGQKIAFLLQKKEAYPPGS